MKNTFFKKFIGSRNNKKYSHSFSVRITATYTLLAFLFQLVNPIGVLASVSGPVQMEYMGASGSGGSDMVDLTTGDFNYDIPLVQADGYDLTLKYNSNVGMESEASWVGLGWQLNTGAITRNMRGIPDDFNGEKIKEKKNYKKDYQISKRNGREQTVGMSFGSSVTVGNLTGSYFSNKLGWGTEEEYYHGGSWGQLTFGSSKGGQMINYQEYGYLNFVNNSLIGNNISLSKSFSTKASLGLSFGFKWFAVSARGHSTKVHGTTDYYNSRKGNLGIYQSEMASSGWGFHVSGPFNSGIGGNFSFGNASGIFESSEIPVSFQHYPGDMITSGTSKVKKEGFTVAYSYKKFSASQSPYDIWKENSSTTALKNNGISIETPAVGALHNYHSSHLKNSNPYTTPILDYYKENNRPYKEGVNTRIANPIFTKDHFYVNNPSGSYSFQVDPSAPVLLGVRRSSTEGSNNGTFNSRALNASHGNVAKDVSSTGYSNQQFNRTTEKWWNNKLEWFNDVFFSSQEEDYSMYLGSPDYLITDPNYHNSIGMLENPVFSPLAVVEGEIGVSQYVFDNKLNLGVYPNTRNTRWNQSRNNVFIQNLRSSTSTSFIPSESANSYFKIDGSYTGTKSVSSTVSNTLGKHQLKRFNHNDANGRNHIYAIPVVNHKKVQASFNIDHNSKQANGNCSYELGVDNTVNNNKGRHNFFQSSETPAYASSFLLTSIEYPDYIDLTGNGISDDDLGSYALLNYTKAFNKFKWRIPYTTDTADQGTQYFPQANYQEGLKSKSHDDIGSYSYGEKEVWYPHSVETNNHIIEFELMERHDVVSALGEEGGRDINSKLWRLEKIYVYAKEDRRKNGTDAKPIKQIEFKYNYSLCKKVYTSDDLLKGKLTLTDVIFTEGESKKQVLSPYLFEYTSINPEYNPMEKDMWGNYKKSSYSTYPNNDEFPYVHQDKADADHSAGAWKLSKITQPSGSIINVTYESDDYGYVQNQPAMSLMKILGFSNSNDIATKNEFLYEKSNGALPRNYLFVDIGTKPSGYSKLDFAYEYLDREVLKKGVNHALGKTLYTKTMTNITGLLVAHWEYINTYVRILDFGVLSNGKAWIKIGHPVREDVNKKPDITYNPISEFGAQMHRTSFVEELFVNSINANEEEKLKTSNLLGANSSREINLNKSFVRLLCANGTKYGGGARVKKIEFSDGWSKMTSGTSGTLLEKSYGQEYTYTLSSGKSSGVASYEPFSGGEENPIKQPLWDNPEKIHFNFRFQEKSWKMFKKDIDKNETDFIITNYSYSDIPIAHSLYPSARITYSEVRINPIKHASVSRNGVGHTQYSFYTYKDFPIISNLTMLASIPTISTSIPEPIGRSKTSQWEASINDIISHFKSENRVEDFKASHISGFSQGFITIQNDMNGKLKQVGSFDEHGLLISSTRYNYKNKKLDKFSLLNNQVSTINSHGEVKTKQMGVQVEIANELNKEFETKSSEGDRVTNEKYMIDPFISGIVNLINKDNSLGQVKSNSVIFGESETTSIKSSSTMKVVKQKGILESIETFNNSKHYKTSFLAYDDKTAQPLLTSSINDYGEEIYNFNYPAYWSYPRMGGAYKNQGQVVIDMEKGSTNKMLKITSPNHFVKGDQLLLSASKSSPAEPDMVVWVTSISGTDLHLVKSDGTEPTFNINIPFGKVTTIHSGYTNQMTAMVGNVTCMTNPIAGSSLAFSDVLSASAIELSDEWQMPCADNIGEPVDFLILCSDAPPLPTGTVNPFSTYPSLGSNPCTKTVSNKSNPFLTGLRGKFRPKKTFQYDIDRAPSTASLVKGNLKTTGKYSSFTKFWKYDATADKLLPILTWNSSLGDWKKESEITLYDANGKVLEQTDASDRFSSSLYGYNSMTQGQVIMAEAVDAKYNEMAYDGFEDYYAHSSSTHCNFPSHFSFYGQLIADNFISDKEAHTGKYSLLLCSGNYIGNSRNVDNCKQSSTRVDETTIQSCDCLPKFSPTVGKEYLISAWVKESDKYLSSTYGEFSNATSYTGAAIEIRQYDNSTIPVLLSTTSLNASGPIVEGWQRVYESVTLNPLTASVEVRLKASSVASTYTYFDDFRMQPYTASMVSYVYDLTNMQLLAKLDAENFATFYEYDRSGALLSQKAETVEGIVTTTENRSAIQIH